MRRLYPKLSMTLVSSTTKQTMAAFSKSVNCASQGLNSTRQPMGESGGGGLNRMVCQLVDWMFSKWSVSLESSWSIFSLNRETVSLKL